MPNVVAFPATRQEIKGRTPLSEREIEVLELRHLQNKEIAQILGCAPTTVKTHWRLLFRRLGVTTREAAFEAWCALQGERMAA